MSYQQYNSKGLNIMVINLFCDYTNYRNNNLFLNKEIFTEYF